MRGKDGRKDGKKRIVGAGRLGRPIRTWEMICGRAVVALWGWGGMSVGGLRVNEWNGFKGLRC